MEHGSETIGQKFISDHLHYFFFFRKRGRGESLFLFPHKTSLSIKLHCKPYKENEADAKVLASDGINIFVD